MYPINLNNSPDGFELIEEKDHFNPKEHLQLKNLVKFIL